MRANVCSNIAAGPPVGPNAMPRTTACPVPPDREKLDLEIARLRGLEVEELRARWHSVFRRRASTYLPWHLLVRILA